MNMKKPFLFITLVIVFVIALVVITRITTNIAYEKGQKEKVCSCELKDICSGGYKENSYEANYEKGFKYQIYECAVITGRAKIEDDFEFEGDWDKCDDEGNCEPFVKNDQVLSN